MTCPKCGSQNVYVRDSRDEKDGRRRRKKCADCDHRWTTIEVGLEEYRKKERLYDAVKASMAEDF